ncbi:hypothetical protein N0V88_000149 [Collariella sp. IMI 366227]|nr:hypothetical protein N0V88_000149 [Collariella sp. IMI 366227]
MPDASASGASASANDAAARNRREHNQGNQERKYTVEQKAAVLRIRRCEPTAFYEILELQKSCSDGVTRLGFDTGPQFVFNFGGGPNVRVHQFGGARPRARPRNPGQEEPASTWGTIIGLLPIFILLFWPIISSIFSGLAGSAPATPSMAFDAPNPPHYTMERTMPRLKVKYYLNPVDVQSYSDSKLYSLDKKAEIILVQQLRLKCESEQNHKLQLQQAAQGWFRPDPEKMEVANAFDMPASLRPGPKEETNPFKRKMSLSKSGASSQGDLRGQAAPPNIPPVPSLALEDFSQLNINDNTNPWQPAIANTANTAPPVPRLPDQESARDNVWDSARPSRQPTPGPRSRSPALPSLPVEEGSPGWEVEPKKPQTHPALITTADEEVLEDAHAWDDFGTVGKGKGPANPPPVPGKAGADDWNLIDVDTRPGPPSRQDSWENFKDEDHPLKPAPPAGKSVEHAPPALPPRNSAELPPIQPPRPVDKNETYQIKNISWHDVTAAKNPRTSPILVQNANGPCPLVALVNALTLTTPADKPDVPLPDVTELYGFLQGLHTGMNVNPRFIPAPEVVTAFKRTSLTHIHPSERTDMIPGTFEHTKEMALYSIFSIPLIHGWLPSKDDAVYEAFLRQAVSYEDAQNLLFREEELEDKLCNHHQGLSPEEQQIYQDILTIKSFLSISATQLTNFGLNVIRKAMKPGSVAILFRNDHFSTLYRHPQTQELITLVTDAGYAGHAEVVWESLADVNGESAEFFSGDFRLVGGANGQAAGQSAQTMPGSWTDRNNNSDNSEWTTVQNSRRGRPQTAQKTTSATQPPLPTHEQEDRDLALALQLQEEEDERARAEQERRRRDPPPPPVLLPDHHHINNQDNQGNNKSGLYSSKN